MLKAKAAEPDVAEVNRLLRNEPPTGTSRTVDIEHALAVLRSENNHLRDILKTNADREAQNEDIRAKNHTHDVKEKIRLQSELLAAQELIVAPTLAMLR
jgi:hypothetical protein